jgi:hypothetical protein
MKPARIIAQDQAALLVVWFSARAQKTPSCRQHSSLPEHCFSERGNVILRDSNLSSTAQNDLHLGKSCLNLGGGPGGCSTRGDYLPMK